MTSDEKMSHSPDLACWRWMNWVRCASADAGNSRSFTVTPVFLALKALIQACVTPVVSLPTQYVTLPLAPFMELGSIALAPAVLLPPSSPPPPPPPPSSPPHAARTRAQTNAANTAPKPKRPLMRPLLQGPTALCAVTGFRSTALNSGAAAGTSQLAVRLSRVGGRAPVTLSRHGGAGGDPPSRSHDPGCRTPCGRERRHGVPRAQRRAGRARRDARPGPRR